MLTVKQFRDNLMVTAAMRAAYMHDKDLIELPSGEAGEHEISKFIGMLVDTYPMGCDVNFDEYIEKALTIQFSPVGDN